MSSVVPYRLLHPETVTKHQTPADPTSPIESLQHGRDRFTLDHRRERVGEGARATRYLSDVSVIEWGVPFGPANADGSRGSETPTRHPDMEETRQLEGTAPVQVVRDQGAAPRTGQDGTFRQYVSAFIGAYHLSRILLLLPTRRLATFLFVSLDNTNIFKTVGVSSACFIKITIKYVLNTVLKKILLIKKKVGSPKVCLGSLLMNEVTN